MSDRDGEETTPPVYSDQFLRFGEFQALTKNNDEEDEGRSVGSEIQAEKLKMFLTHLLIRFPKLVRHNWPIKFHKDSITWLNTQHKAEENMAFISYGNQAELDWFYTSVVILVIIGTPSERVPSRANRNMSMMNVERNNQPPKRLVPENFRENELCNERLLQEYINRLH